MIDLPLTPSTSTNGRSSSSHADQPLGPLNAPSGIKRKRSHGLAISTTNPARKLQKRKSADKQQGFRMANLATLGSSGFLHDDADVPENRVGNSVDETVTQRKIALDQLFKGARYKDVTRGRYDWSCRQFPTRAVKPEADSNGSLGWRLKDMKCRLRDHQLFGAARMRFLEERDEAPHGGILADAMGLGKTIQALATITGDILSHQHELLAHSAPRTPRFLDEDDDHGDSNDAEDMKPNNATLVVVPGSGLKTQWYDEIQNKCMLKATIYRKSDELDADMNFRVLNYDIVITTYNEIRASWVPDDVGQIDGDIDQQTQYWENQVRREKAMGVLHQLNFRRIVLDEAHHIKDATSATSKACRALHGKRRWIVSGTPLQNGAFEAFPYLDFIGVPGVTTQASFNKLCRKHPSHLKTLLHNYMIRRTQATTYRNLPIHDIPPCHKHIDGLSLDGAELEYDARVTAWVRKAVMAINKSDLNVKDKTSRVHSLILRSRQIDSHFLLTMHFLPFFGDDELLQQLIEEKAAVALPPARTMLLVNYFNNLARTAKAQTKALIEDRQKKLATDDEVLEALLLTSKKSTKIRFSMGQYLKWGGIPMWSSKVKRVIQDLEQSLAEDSDRKIIVFSQFLETLAILKHFCDLKQWGSTLYTGSMAAKAQSKAIAHWRQFPEVPIFLASLKKGGEGLNLTAGQEVLMVEPWWNEAAQDQAFARVTRIGQTKKTKHKLFFVTNSQESIMYRIQKRKSAEINPLMETARKQGPKAMDELASSYGFTTDDVDDMPKSTRAPSVSTITSEDSDEEDIENEDVGEEDDFPNINEVVAYVASEKSTKVTGDELFVPTVYDLDHQEIEQQAQGQLEADEQLDQTQPVDLHEDVQIKEEEQNEWQNEWHDDEGTNEQQPIVIEDSDESDADSSAPSAWLRAIREGKRGASRWWTKAS